MIHVRASRTNRIRLNGEIINFYTNLWYDRFMFGNNIAIVQECCHDKDYHNDTLETEPFKMDNPDDKSHLVDWKEIKLKSIIQETINQYLKRNIMQ